MNRLLPETGYYINLFLLVAVLFLKEFLPYFADTKRNWLRIANWALIPLLLIFSAYLVQKIVGIIFWLTQA